MDATERARLRALCSVDDDPVRVLRADLADLLDAIDAAERERDALRAKVKRLRAALFDAWCDLGSPGDGWDALDMTEAEYRAWIGEPAETVGGGG